MLKYGDRIAKLREQHNLTQEELSNKIGISRAALSHYEKNRREADYETLQKIAEYFEVTTDYLLGGSDNPRMTADEEFEAFANDPELGRWYKELPQSDEEDLQKLRQMWEIIRSDKNRRD